jgi:5-methylcytosine-specific restriction enzyme subunit McrC
VDVTALPRGRDLPKWRATRLNARYHPALRLATLVLSGASVEHLAGAVRVSGFLFDMNKVFEDFVTVALREALSAAGRPGYGKLQARQNLDLAETVLMKPDFVWYDDANLPRAVVDAKYKAEKPEGFPDADLYQLLAYCIALGLTEGHLIYARGNAAHASHAVRNTGIRIHQHTVDLDQAPEPLLAELARISGLVLVTT